MVALSQQLIEEVNGSPLSKCKSQERRKTGRAAHLVVLAEASAIRHLCNCSSQRSRKSRKPEEERKLVQQLKECRMQRVCLKASDLARATKAQTTINNRLTHCKMLINSRTFFFKMTLILQII
jgi:hypothetical protein